MDDWTEESVRSLTSRQVVERERSARVRVFEEEEEEVERRELVRSSRDLRMSESGLRWFLKGSWVSSSEIGSGRRRFFLSAMEDT